MIITIEMQTPAPSASGKTLVVASSHGNQATTAVPKQVATGRVSGALESPDSTAELLVQAIGILGEMVFEKGREFPQLVGMGATVAAGVVVGESLVIAHLGDSRAYLLRRGSLERLTDDHTMADLLLEAKAISKKTYRDHPGQHMLRRFVGMQDCPAADIGILDLQSGDRILMCSDGLTGMVDDRTIGQVLLDEPDGQTACQKLVDLANKAGGKDNVTIVISDVPTNNDETKRPKKITVCKAVGNSLRRPSKIQEKTISETDDLMLEECEDE